MGRSSVVSGPHTEVSGVESGSRVESAVHGQSADYASSSTTNAIDGTPDDINDDTYDINDDTYDINDDTYDTDNDTYASSGNSNADNVGIMRALTPDVEQRLQRAGRHNPLLTHLTGTNDVLFAGTGKEEREAG
jgi:hypothetical protein